MQLDFINNINLLPAQNYAFSNATVSFIPFNFPGSISFKNLNLLFYRGATGTFTVSATVGLYSLNAGTLSLANLISASFTHTTSGIGNSVNIFYMPVTNTSSNQNVTPGTWWFGIHLSTATAGQAGVISYIGARTINPGNAFPGNFAIGRMTASTSSIPTSIATSDLDITGSDAISIPQILLSA